MFSTGFSLLLGYLASYIFLPLIPGIIAMWLLGIKYLRGVLFYTSSWFVGVGLVGYGIFLLQFMRFGVDTTAYFIIVGVLALLFIVKQLIAKSRLTRNEILRTLTFSRTKIIGWNEYSTRKKIMTVVIAGLVIAYIFISFYFVSHFPSYADDSFGNWHVGVIHMIYDGGFTVFGEPTQILARGRLGYPIMMAVFQALVGVVNGGYNDIYINIFQWLGVTFFLLFSISFVYKKTQNIFYALLGPACIISLPLLFLHTTQGYMDLLSGLYAALAMMFFYDAIDESHKESSIILGFLLLAILSYIKNDGIVVYAPAVLVSFIAYILIFKKVSEYKKIYTSVSFWVVIAAMLLIVVAPFTYLKLKYSLAFNPTAEGSTLSSLVHREIFPAIWKTIWDMNNYSLAPQVMFIAVIYAIVTYRRKNSKKIYLIAAPTICIILFTAVFLLTENYKYVLDQTTVNRVYTICFVMFFSILPLVIHDGE